MGKFLPLFVCKGTALFLRFENIFQNGGKFIPCKASPVEKVSVIVRCAAFFTKVVNGLIVPGFFFYSIPGVRRIGIVGGSCQTERKEPECRKNNFFHRSPADFFFNECQELIPPRAGQ